MNLGIYLLVIVWAGVILLIIANILKAHIKGKIFLIGYRGNVREYHWKYKEDKLLFIFALMTNYTFLFVFMTTLPFILDILRYSS